MGEVGVCPRLFLAAEVWCIHMAQSGTKHPQTRVSGQIIIDELVRNMDLGRLELGYSILLPCLFSVYLHPDDYDRLIGVQDLIREDARRALTARMADWNKKGVLRRGATRKEYKIAQSTWWIELFRDGENAVPPGDVEIHSELNDVVQPGYRGTKTTLIERQPSVTSARVVRDRESTRRNSADRGADRVYAEIHYNDDSGPQTYFVTQNEISVGRGGEGLWVDLPLYASDQVSREHLKLRRDPATGAFVITDQSRNGTWLNGRRLPNGAETAMPERAEIRVAEVITLSFEARK
jgi:hypothetical protein